MDETEKTALSPETEIWLDLPGFEGLYEVSNMGRVRGLPRTTSDGKSLKFRYLTGRPHDKTGYIHFGVGVDSRRYTLMVHRAICEAFNGPPLPGKPNALHRNGDPSDNRPENLYWGNQSDNNYDSVAHGVHPNARKTHCRNGHAYTPDNTYYSGPKAWRKCKICFAASDKKRKGSR